MNGFMASPREKLAESLDVLKALQHGNRRVFRSEDLSRVHRERLVENGFLQEVMKGWLISSSPEAHAGESTPWHASFWEFCARYCDERFGEQWHLSPEQSLFLHGERTVRLAIEAGRTCSAREIEPFYIAVVLALCRQSRREVMNALQLLRRMWGQP